MVPVASRSDDRIFSPAVSGKTASLTIAHIPVVRFFTLRWSCSGIFYNANPILGAVIIRASYIESVEVLVIHVWAGVFFFTSALVSRWLLIEDALFAAFYVQAAGAVTNVGFNFWLIPKYGVVGAAIATVLSAFISGYVVLLFHPKMYPMGKLISWSFCLPLRLTYHLFIKNNKWLNR